MKGPTNEELFAQYHAETNPFKKEFIREDFFANNTKLSYFVARKFKDSIVGFEDSVALCHMGMVVAFDSFDPSKGYKFTTYAALVMSREVLKEIRRIKKHQGVLSLDDLAYGKQDDDSSLSLLDRIADESMSIEQLVENEELVRILKDGQQYFLSDREQGSIAHLMDDEIKTQSEISKEIGVTQAQVSRLQRRALEKAKTYLTEHEVAQEVKKPKKKVKRMTTKPAEIKLPEGSVYEKIKFLMDHYPGMTPATITMHVGAPKATVYTYMSQIKKLKQAVTSIPAVKSSKEILESVVPGVAESIAKTKEPIPSAKIATPKMVVAPRQETSSPSLVSLSLKDISSTSLERTLNHFIGLLQENEIYDLTIDIIKQ